MESTNTPAEDTWDVVLESTSSKPVMTSFDVNIGVDVNFFVEFTPSEKKRISAEIRLSVVDNPFEDTVIQLLGEGFEEEVTIENIHGGQACVQAADSEGEEDEMSKSKLFYPISFNSNFLCSKGLHL